MSDKLCPSCLSLGESTDDFHPDGIEMHCPICGDEWFIPYEWSDEDWDTVL